jgi:hypothetical protein
MHVVAPGMLQIYYCSLCDWLHGFRQFWNCKSGVNAVIAHTCCAVWTWHWVQIWWPEIGQETGSLTGVELMTTLALVRGYQAYDAIAVSNAVLVIAAVKVRKWLKHIAYGSTG